MSERPRDSSGLTSGDPLRGDDEPPRHESGLPGMPPPPPARPRESIWSGGAYGPMSPPPPGAGGMAPAFGTQPVAGRYVLAGWWSRVGAQIIDGLILSVAALVVLVVFGAVLFSGGSLGGEESGVAALIVGFLVWLLALVIAAMLYAPLLMARTNGKTLGRMATGIRVVRADGQPMTFGFAMLREVAVKALLFGFAGAVSGGIANLLDWLWPLWDEENRALHDFIVNTRSVVD